MKYYHKERRKKRNIPRRLAKDLKKELIKRYEARELPRWEILESLYRQA